MTKSGVIANSFPKSGTHVLVRILDLLNYEASPIHISRSLVNMGPRNLIRNLGVLSRRSSHASAIPIDIENPNLKIRKSWIMKYIMQNLYFNQYCQAHIPFSKLFESLLLEMHLPMLYIHRHPLDTLVSLRNYILNKKNYPTHKILKTLHSEEEQYSFLINGYEEKKGWKCTAPFFTKYENSLQWSRVNGVCTVIFEEVIGESGGGTNALQLKALERITSYLGIEVDSKESVSRKIYNRQSPTFNKGRIGNWQSDLPPIIIDKCLKIIRDRNIDLTKYALSGA